MSKVYDVVIRSEIEKYEKPGWPNTGGPYFFYAEIAEGSQVKEVKVQADEDPHHVLRHTIKPGAKCKLELEPTDLPEADYRLIKLLQ